MQDMAIISQELKRKRKSEPQDSEKLKIIGAVQQFGPIRRLIKYLLPLFTSKYKF